MSVNKMFAKYVSQNIMGMIGISLYILADTFFISKAQGADGITALNLVLPLYSLIFAIGSMIGVGSATRFKILRAKTDAQADTYFTNALFWACICSLPFMLAGGVWADGIMALLGADERIIEVGTIYTRIFMLFAPFFMCNYVFNAFVRNDGAPSLAMAATLCSSLFNIVMDYVLMFPLKLGMAGAALATALSPVVGILICSMHFGAKDNTIPFCLAMPSIRKLALSCQLGVAAFVGEISSGVTTAVFNMLILGLAGNVGVAAYAVVANTALVAVSVFNGISQGCQPILSEFYGKGDKKATTRVLRLGIILALIMAAAIILGIMAGAEGIVAIFNGEQDAQLASYAVPGIKLYFIGFLFAGINIVGTGFLSATEKAGWAFAASILRGFIAISVCAVVMPMCFGMVGVWLAFPVAELLTALVTGRGLYCSLKDAKGV